MQRRFLVLASVLLCGAVHASPRGASQTAAAQVPSPAPAGSLAPQLTTDPAGRAILSWLEPAGDTRRFVVAARDGGNWTSPVTIAEEPRVFANWADVPAVATLPDGTWAAHWLSSTGRASYDVKVSLSKDSGRTWGSPVIPHRDGTRTEHGFASLAAWPDGALGMIWLDGREYAGHHDGAGAALMKGQMALRSARFERDGPGDEMVVDPRVCDCCPTAIARTRRGIIAAYRDRSDGEIRDIYTVRYEGGRWLAPARVHPDEWRIAACPVNGPALASQGDRVAIAWFSAAGDVPRVSVAYSSDGGATFGAPVRVDDGSPEGRVDLAMLATGTAIVTWIERAATGWEVRMRQVDPKGAKGEAVSVTRVKADRSSGYPRVVASRRELVFAWTDGGVKTAVAPLPR